MGGHYGSLRSGPPAQPTARPQLGDHSTLRATTDWQQSMAATKHLWRRWSRPPPASRRPDAHRRAAALSPHWPTRHNVCRCRGIDLVLVVQPIVAGSPAELGRVLPHLRP